MVFVFEFTILTAFWVNPPQFLFRLHRGLTLSQGGAFFLRISLQISMKFVKMKSGLFSAYKIMNISIKKDGEGYLAEVVGKENCYAF